VHIRSINPIKAKLVMLLTHILEYNAFLAYWTFNVGTLYIFNISSWTVGIKFWKNLIHWVQNEFITYQLMSSNIIILILILFKENSVLLNVQKIDVHAYKNLKIDPNAFFWMLKWRWKCVFVFCLISVSPVRNFIIIFYFILNF